MTELRTRLSNLSIAWRSALLAAALTLPVTGFIAGLILAEVDGGILVQVVWRIVIGFMVAILTVMFLGRPPLDEGGVMHAELYFYMPVVFVILFVLIFFFPKWRG